MKFLHNSERIRRHDDIHCRDEIWGVFVCWISNRTWGDEWNFKAALDGCWVFFFIFYDTLTMNFYCFASHAVCLFICGQTLFQLKRWKRELHAKEIRWKNVKKLQWIIFFTQRIYFKIYLKLIIPKNIFKNNKKLKKWETFLKKKN